MNLILSEESENRYGFFCKVLMFMDVSFGKIKFNIVCFSDEAVQTSGIIC